MGRTSLFHMQVSSFPKAIDFIYLFLERGDRRERNINVWLLLTHPLLGTWLVNQACALTGNWTGDPLVRRPALNPLSYTSQGKNRKFWNLVITGCEVQKVQRKGVRSCGGVKMGLAKQLNLGFQHMLNIVLNVEWWRMFWDTLASWGDWWS